jgi:hypothetical protein
MIQQWIQLLIIVIIVMADAKQDALNAMDVRLDVMKTVL